MKFWSTGTGQNTLDVSLIEADAVREGDHLIFKGKMGPPVFWEYTMKFSEEDFISFFAIARDPKTVQFIVNSPNRWKLFFSMAVDATKFTLMTVPRLFKTIFFPKGNNGEEKAGEPAPEGASE